MEKYLYHLVVDKAEREKILSDGLIPLIGSNSEIAGEETPAVYLTDAKSVPYWEIILGRSLAVRIDAAALHQDAMQRNKLDGYTEVIYTDAIPASAISKCGIRKDCTRAMRHLCDSYMWGISYLTSHFARYYNEESHTKESHLDMKIDVETSMAVLRRLDYSVMSKQEKRENIYEQGPEGACMCTFVDWYEPEYEQATTRLYSQLLKYPEDEFWKLRKELHGFIVKNFKCVLRMETGGWTG